MTMPETVRQVCNRRGYLVVWDLNNNPTCLGLRLTHCTFDDGTELWQNFTVVSRTTIEDAQEQQRMQVALGGEPFRKPIPASARFYRIYTD